MFLNLKKMFFTFRGPIKYLESAPPELGWSGEGKQFFKSSLIKIDQQF